MRFLVHILLAVAVMVCGVLLESGGKVRVQWMPALLLIPYGLMGFWRRWAIRRDFRIASLFAKIANFSGVLAFGIALGFLGWVDYVRAWTGQSLRHDDWPDWGLVVCFAPFVAYQVAAIHAEAWVDRSARRPVMRQVRVHVRSLFAALAPLVLYMAVSIVSARSEVWKANIESVELFGGMYFLGITMLLGAMMPMLLSHTWETSSLPQGPARQLFEDVAEQAQFKARKLLLWDTDNMVANAAIVGMSPRLRIVLLSDSLLSMLGARELACVYGHEIGHAKRHHVPIFIGWAVFFLIGGEMLVWSLLTPDGWLGIASFGVTLALWYVCFGWLSRRFELEADLYSMQLTGDPEALIQALERVGGGNRDRGGWRHFSTARRVGFLHRAAFDDVFRMRFLRRIRLMGRAGLVLGACVGVLYLGGLVQRFSGDRLHVHLALGTYDAAWAKGGGVALEVSEDFGDLLQTAAGLANENGQPVALDRLRSELRESLQAGAFGDARILARLLALRDDPVADRLVAAMGQEDPATHSGETLVDWPEPWREFALHGLRQSGN